MAAVPRAALPALAFITCVLIWGSTWLAIKVGYEGVGALTGAGLRFGAAALIFAAIARWQGATLALRGPVLRVALFVGAMTFVLDYGLIYWAEQSLSSGMTAVLFATMPFSTAPLAAALLGERMSLRTLGGAALGIGGLALIFRGSLVADPTLLVPMAAVLVAAIAASVGSVAVKRWAHGTPTTSLMAWAMGSGSLGLLAWGALAGERVGLPTTGIAWASVAYLAVFGSVIAFQLYLWLLRSHAAVKASLVAVSTPVVALALGAAALGESLGLAEVAGAALVLVGVSVAVTGPSRARAAAKPAEADPEPA